MKRYKYKVEIKEINDSTLKTNGEYIKLSLELYCTNMEHDDWELMSVANIENNLIYHFRKEIEL